MSHARHGAAVSCAVYESTCQKKTAAQSDWPAPQPQMDVVVVGASNTDLTSYVDRLPAPGETIHGRSFVQGRRWRLRLKFFVSHSTRRSGAGFGGKGANQAVMAAKMGAATAMVTKLGDDIFGHDTLKNFASHGIDIAHVHITKEAATGVAPITVDSHGQNSIIIVNGANDLLSPANIDAATTMISSARVLVTQLEIKPETTLAALRLAHAAKIHSIFNAAPARPTLDAEFYTLPTIFCLNETEASMLTGVKSVTQETAKDVCKILRSRGASTIVLTLGQWGSYVKSETDEFHVPADSVPVLDTSGAGDAFVGALAFYLARAPQLALQEMIVRSGHIASISVQQPGTQSSYPSRSLLPESLFATA
eukprot:m.223281 g.223281  ORF g.223281 m.223281 type:complete len:365 (-) comp54186_c0_seq3:40-1134(-)